MKIKSLILLGIISLFPINFLAVSTYDSEVETIENNDQLCANNEYKIEVGNEDKTYKANIISVANKGLLDTVYSSDGQINLSFPSNVEKLKINIVEATDTESKPVEELSVKVKDCGYSKKVDDHTLVNLKAKIEIEDQVLKITKPDSSDYQLFINQISDNDNGKSKKVKFKDNQAEIKIDSNYIQITEVYKDKKNKKIQKFFEIDLSENDYIIRTLKGVDLKVVKPLEYIKKNILIRILIGFICIIILYLINRQLKAEYNRRKREKRRLKEIKYKKIKEMQSQKKRKQKEKELYYLKKQKEKEEIERRHNLEIRK